MLDWIAWSTVYIAILLYCAMLDWIAWSTVYIATLLYGSCELLGQDFWGIYRVSFVGRWVCFYAEP
jgi:hypothetical protein